MNHKSHCEFCDAEPTRRFAPCSLAIIGIYGIRLSCDRHLHWVRRLMFLDLGDVRIDEKRTKDPHEC